jgi:pimeloyl-ACP methyl ester carboxylesterase
MFNQGAVTDHSSTASGTSPDLKSFREAFPELRIIDVNSAGHWVHADRPADFLAALAQTPALAK